jgi:uncharacterized protein (TIGR02453 family)
MQEFSGLPKDFFAFFNELHFNNEKRWFEANKTRYKSSVVEPLCALIAAIGESMPKVSKHIVCDARPNGGSMFRIYRDTRFSKDKTPYKSNAGLHFRHALGRDAHAPGFYMHFAPKEVFFGGGLWMPEPDDLAKIRRRIADGPKDWAKVTSALASSKLFNGIEGEGLARPPKGFDADHPHVEDLKRKSFYVMHKSNERTALSPKLVDEAMTAFSAAKPLMTFLCKAVDAPI